MCADRFRQGFRTNAGVWLALLTGLVGTLFVPGLRMAEEIGTGMLWISGTRLTVDPVSQTVDLNMPTTVNTHLEGYDPEFGVLPSDLRVRGDFSGPEIDGVLVLETVPNEPLRIPALRVGGEYELANIRLVRAEEVLIVAEQPSVSIEVTQILLTSVTSRPLTADEIRSYGLVLDGENYQALNLTFAFSVYGRTIEYNMPVVYDLYGPDVLFQGLPTVGLPMFGNTGNTVRDVRFTPPRLVPFSVRLEQPEREVIPTGGCDARGGDCRELLPPEFHMVGMILFPTEVSLLHQFFSVVLSVKNGAPEDDPLEVRDLVARIKLPPGLRLGETEPPTVVGAPVPVRTADGLDVLEAQETGDAEFLLEGAEAGTYIVEFEMEGMLEGLPAGIRRVTGEAKGAVMVHDPYLSVRVAHPQVVREDLEYTVYFTVTNLGNAPVNHVKIALPEAGLAGVEILQEEGVVHHVKEIDSLLPGQSEVVEFPILSHLTGNITSTAVETGSSTKPEFEWSLGVGVDSALSGDSLSVPTSSENLPREVLRPALALVGLGYSLAQAPQTAGSELPQVSMTEVNERIYRLSQAGLHRELGEELFDVLAILACELNGARDDGWYFDQLRREHKKGGELAAAVAAQLSALVASPEEAFERFAATTAFLGPQAVLAVGDGATVEVSSRTSGKAVAGSGLDPERVRDLPFAELYEIAGPGMTDTEMVVLLSDEESGGYRVRLRHAAGGTAELHLLVPDAAGELRVVRWTGVALGADAEAVAEFQRDDDMFILAVDEESDGVVDYHLEGDVTFPEPRPFKAIAAVQDAIADPSGHVLQVLFSEDVDLASLVDESHKRDPDHFVLPGNVSNGGLFEVEAEIVGGLLGQGGVGNPLAGLSNPRIVRVIFDNPVSPLVKVAHELTVSGLTSAGGRSLGPEPQTVTVTTTATENAMEVRGTVIGPYGDPVPYAQVVLLESDRTGFGAYRRCAQHPTAVVTADAEGNFYFDYVRETECHDIFEIRADHFDPDPEKRFWGKAAGRVRITEEEEEEPFRLNVVMPGRGRLHGQVRYQDGEIPEEIHVVASNRNRNQGRLAYVDENGFYNVEDVVVGTVTLAAYDGERNYAYRTVELPEAGAVVERDLIIVRRDPAEPPPGQLRGTVLLADDESPACDAWVALYVDEQLIAVERSDSDGRFDFGLVPVGIAEIEAFSDTSRLSGARLVLEIEPDQIIDQEILLHDERGVVRGVVYRRSWEYNLGEAMPVAGAVVWADGTPFHTMTGADGSFQLDDVFAGTWQIHAVDLAANEATSTKVTITSSGEVDCTLYFDDALPQGGIIGRVLSYDGTTPLIGAKVHLAHGYYSTNWHHETTTNDDGYFAIAGLGPGVYGVHAMGGHKPSGEAVSGGGIGWANVRFPGATAYAEVKYRQQTIRVCTVQEQDNGEETAVVSEIAYRKVEVVGAWGVVALARDYTYAMTNEDGCLDIEALTGPYQIYVFNGSLGTRSVKGELIEGGDPPLHKIVFKPKGTIRGVLYNYDGETPVAGETVALTGASYSNYELATGADGEFAFPFLDKGHTYRIRVSHSDGTILRQQQISVAIDQDGQVVDVDLVLPEQGSVVGQVLMETGVDEDGLPITKGVKGAVVTLYEAAYPHRRLIQNADFDGYFAFDNIAAGMATVHAVAPELGGLGGRTKAEIECEAEEVAAEVFLEPVGEVVGTVLRPGADETAVPNAQVWLVRGGALVGAITSDENGEYRFRFLPLGNNYEIRVFDPGTACNGSTWFDVETAHQVVTANTTLQVRGDVQGTFFDRRIDEAGVPFDTPIPGSVIRLTPTGWYHSTYSSTDLAGYFLFEGIPEGLFELFAREDNGRRIVYASGEILAEGEPVTVDLILQPTGKVTGEVLNPPGMEPGSFENANVRVVQDGRVIGASIGKFYEFDGLIAGRDFEIRATEIGGLREGRSRGKLLEAGGEVPLDVRMQAMGSVKVTVTESDDLPVEEPADVLVRNRHDYGREFFYGSTGGDPEVIFFDIRQGGLWAHATNPQGLRGSVSGELETEGQQVELTVKLQATGTIRGRAVLPDGVRAAAFARVALYRLGKWYLSAADETGYFELESLPLGTYKLIVQEDEGSALIERYVSLTSDGEVVECGNMVLDGADPYVVSITPPSGTRNLDPSTTIKIEFSEPIDDSRSASALALRERSGCSVSFDRQWSDDYREVTISPNQSLESETCYDVDVTKGIYDLAGRNMSWPVRSTFYTRDYIRPTVIHMVPADKANQVPVDTAIRVTFSEPVQVASLSGQAFQLLQLCHPEQGVPTNPSFLLDDDLLHTREVIFTHENLENDCQYQITIDNVMDEAGNSMDPAVVTTFWTPDLSDPLAEWTSPQEGAEFTAGDDIFMEVEASDNRGLEEITFTLGAWSKTVVAGSDVASHIYVNSGTFSEVLPAPIMTSAGEVVLTATVLDVFGNDYEITRTIQVAPLDNAEKPEVVSPCPANGDLVAPGLEIPIPYALSDDHKIESYWIEINGELVEEWTPVNAPSVEGTYLWTPPADAAPGQSFTFQIYARDFADNEETHHPLRTLWIPDAVLLSGDQTVDGSYAGESLALAAGTFEVTEPLALAELAILHAGELVGAEPAMEIEVTGVVKVQCGGVIHAVGTGYAAGDPGHLAGYGPPGIATSLSDGGGSHGGCGSVKKLGGPVGEIYDSVYRPSLGGAGGSLVDGYETNGGGGGGAVMITAGELVVDGEIQAAGELGRGYTAGGAGGSVRITAATLSGDGLIDASGGFNENYMAAQAGAGGGGRVALAVGAFNDFDPETQVSALSSEANTGSGTVYFRTAASTYGSLRIDGGDVDTELPALGSGAILATELDPAGLWVTGPSAFRVRWLGAWMELDGAGESLGTYEVVDRDAGGRLLLAGAFPQVPVESYRGEYRFDEISLRHGAGLKATDPLRAARWVLAGEVAIPGAIEASEVVIEDGARVRPLAGGELHFQVDGTMTIGGNAVLDVVGLRYAVGNSDHPAGYGPPGILTSLPDGGGSHGGFGSVKKLEGPVGEVYDSVYRPSLGGSGGASYWANGGGGGGVVTIAAGELVVDGEIQAAGELGRGYTAGGAGGSVRITADTLSGNGLIDASGGLNEHYMEAQAGGGGGGRVALDVGTFDGFDPMTRVSALGSEISTSSGTVYFRTAASTYGDLVVESHATDVAVTPLPTIGQGIVGTVTPAGETDVWIEPQDPETRFSVGVVGMWVRVHEVDYPVIGEREDRRGVLLAGAVDAVHVGNAYLGVYKFDTVSVLGGARLELRDADEVGTWNVDADSEVIRYDWQSPVVTLVAPDDDASFFSGEPIAASVEVTDNTAVAEVRFELAGRSFVDAEAPYEWVVAAPAVAVDSDFVLTVEAIDDEDNRGSAARTLHVKPIAAGVPPVVTVTCGQQAVIVPGAVIEIRVDALSPDALGIDRVEFYLGDDLTPTATAFNPPYAFALEAPASVSAGELLSLRAVAVNFAAQPTETLIEVAVVDGELITADTYLAADDLSLEGATVVVVDGRLTVAGTHHFANFYALGGVVESVPEQPLDLRADGAIGIHCGAQVDVSGLGYPGVGDGASAPEGIAVAAGEAGGSHGGIGLNGYADYPAGEVFDSVVRPALGGGSGGAYGTVPGGAGGGVVTLAADTVIVDGEILANGGPGVGQRKGGGAGGTVMIEADQLIGGGRIEAAGGYTVMNLDFPDGAGGGGRVALHVAELMGFEPGTQIEVHGGVRYDSTGTVERAHAAPGTIYVSTAARPNGELILDAGATEARPATPLPRLGSGAVTAIEAAGVGEAWVSASAPFRPRWLGARMVLRTASGTSLGAFPVKDLDAQGRVLLEQVLSEVTEAVVYAGEYRFDVLTVRGGAGLDAEDPIRAGVVRLADQAMLPSYLAADELTVQAVEGGSTVRSSGSGELHLAVSGTLTIESGATLDVTGGGCPGVAEGANAPEGIAVSQGDAGGSHGGVGLPGEGDLSAGEVFDSVVWPARGGGSGASTTNKAAGAGGGVVTLEADTVILDGEILANAGGEVGKRRGGGAGGTVVIVANLLEGDGRIEASGGFSRIVDGFHSGAGGGGRVALHVGELTGFHPLTQLRAHGGTRYDSTGTVEEAHAAPGTVYVRTGAGHGDLIIAQPPASVPIAATTLPTIGTGLVGLTEDAENTSDLWIEPQDPEAKFSRGVTGMWVRIAGVDYPVVAESLNRRRLLLAGAADAPVPIAAGDRFRGIYRFDAVTIRGGMSVELHDFVFPEVDSWTIEDGSEVIPLDQEPPVITTILPAEGAVFSSGEGIDLSAEASDNTAVTAVRFDFAGQSFTDEMAPFAWSLTAPEVAESADFVLTVTAFDAEGNQASGTRTIRIEVVCSYALDPADESFPAAGGTGTVTVTAPAGCAWTAETAASWIGITAGSSGSGAGAVDYQVAANPSTEARTGTLSVAGQSATVTQAGLETYLLSVVTDGSGTGTVTSSPAGIDCGTDCTEPFTEGTVVTLTATPAADARFAGWSGACSGSGACTFTLTADRTVTASFARICTNPWVGFGPETGEMTALAIAGSTVYAGTAFSLFASPDGGASWSYAGLDEQIHSIAVDPADPAVIYVGSENDVYRSTDAGASWTAAGSGITKVKALVVDPTSATVYAGSKVTGVHKSVDGGVTWQAVTSGLDDLNVRHLALGSSALYAATVGGVFKSLDAAASWVAVNDGLTNPDVAALAVDPSDSLKVFAAGKGGIYRSEDGGASWQPTAVSATITALAISSATPSTLYAGGWSGQVWKSLDGGVSWELGGIAEEAGTVTAVAIDPISSTVFLGTNRRGVFKRVGESAWEESNSGLNGAFMVSLAVDPGSAQTVYAGSRIGTLYKSIDGGAHWNAADSGLASWVHDIAIDPFDPTTLYAATTLGLYKSDDGGGLWSLTGSGGPEGQVVQSLAPDPGVPGLLYAGTNGGGIFKSTDAGVSWLPISTGLTVHAITALALDATDPGVVYAATSPSGMFKSVDAGAQWTAIGEGLPAAEASAVAVHPADGAIVYAVFNGHGVYQSTDGGQSWQSIAAGFSAGRGLAIHPAEPATLFVATRNQARVFKSVDGGATWFARSEGFPDSEILELVVAPQEPHTIFAATRKRSVYQLTECSDP